MSRISQYRGEVAGLLAAWGLAVAVGMLLLGAYSARPGDPGEPPSSWPAGTDVRLDGGRPTLLIFLHPRCPCSRASLAELSTILDRCAGRVSARAIVLQPRRADGGWMATDLRAALAAVPGLRVVLDPGGAEVRRFGVATSGHLLLFDTRGGLIFSGGITPGRGQHGDSASRAALLGRTLGAGGCGPENPVFGCPLATPRSAQGRDG